MSASSATSKGTTGDTTAQHPLRRLLEPYSVLQGNVALRVLLAAASVNALVDWLAVVALCALAYRLTQSATLVGLLTFTRLLPYAVAVPAAGVLSDRVDRRFLLIGATFGRAVCLVGLAAVQSKAMLPLAFGLVFVATLLSSIFRPAFFATLPEVVGERELLDANALFGQADMLSVGVGPVVAGLVLAFGSEALAFAVGGVGLALVGVVLIRLPASLRTEAVHQESTGWMSEVRYGFGFLARAERHVLLGVTLTMAGLTFANGAWWAIATVLVNKNFHLGSQGLGFLMAAYSVGGLISGLGVGEAIRRRGVTALFIAATAATSLALAAVGVCPAGVPPFICLFMIGLSDVVAKVIATTVIQTATPASSLGHVVGALESGLMGATVIGSLIVGPLINAVGAGTAAVVVGATGLGLLAISIPVLLRLEAGLGLRLFLQQVPVLSSVSLVLLDDLAASFRLERVPRGRVIVQQGTRGQHLYLIKRGTVEVVVSGPHGNEVPIATLSSRDYFGETALLQDVPRTATVRAVGSVDLYSLDRSSFQALLRQTEALEETLRATSTGRERARRTIVISSLAYGPLGAGSGLAPRSRESGRSPGPSSFAL